MTISILKTPAEIIQVSPAIVSRWLATESPNVFQLQRKDWLITASSASAGSPAGCMAFTLAAIFTGSIGDSISAYNAYTGKMHTGKVTSIDGSDIETDIPYSATFDGQYLNDSSLYNGFYFEGRLTINDIVQDITIQATPNSFGISDLDVSGLLRITTGLGKIGDGSSLVMAETNKSGKFTFAYRPRWYGSNEAYTEEGHTWYYAEGVRSVEQGSNLADFVPSDAGNAPLFNSFEQPVYFSGFPFDVSFICPEDVGETFTLIIKRFDSENKVIGIQQETINTTGLAGRLCSINIDPNAIEPTAAYLTIRGVGDPPIGDEEESEGPPAGEETGWNGIAVAAANGLLYSICFIDADIGWICGKSATNNSLICKTTNGGASWSEQTTPAGGNTLASIFNLDANNGWAVGWNIAEEPVILHTTDGGVNWSSQTSPVASGRLEEVFFTSASIGWAVGSDGSGQNLILKTTDGGANWVQQTAPAANGHLYGVQFINANTGWAVGDYGGTLLVFKTTDGGANWVQQTAPAVTGHLLAMFCTDANNCWAVGYIDAGNEILIIHTADGGANWAQQTSPVVNQQLRDVYFINANTGWAVGSNGTSNLILKTTNGGANWVTETVETSNTMLMSVHMLSSDLGFACRYDSDEEILKYTA